MYYVCFNAEYDIYISYHPQVPAEASKWETNSGYFDPYQQYQSRKNERKFMHLMACNSIRSTWVDITESNIEHGDEDDTLDTFIKGRSYP